MTVHASMDVVAYNVSIHGWVDNAHRTPSCLPLSVHHALPIPIPVPSHLLDRPHAPEGNVLRFNP